MMKARAYTLQQVVGDKKYAFLGTEIRWFTDVDLPNISVNVNGQPKTFVRCEEMDIEGAQ